MSAGFIVLGSARASRAGDGALAIANLFCRAQDGFGEAPKPAREARALLSRENPALVFTQ